MHFCNAPIIKALGLRAADLRAADLRAAGIRAASVACALILLGSLTGGADVAAQSSGFSNINSARAKFKSRPSRLSAMRVLNPAEEINIGRGDVVIAPPAEMIVLDEGETSPGYFIPGRTRDTYAKPGQHIVLDGIIRGETTDVALLAQYPDGSQTQLSARTVVHPTHSLLLLDWRANFRAEWFVSGYPEWVAVMNLGPSPISMERLQLAEGLQLEGAPYEPIPKEERDGKEILEDFDGILAGELPSNAWRAEQLYRGEFDIPEGDESRRFNLPKGMMLVGAKVTWSPLSRSPEGGVLVNTARAPYGRPQPVDPQNPGAWQINENAEWLRIGVDGGEALVRRFVVYADPGLGVLDPASFDLFVHRKGESIRRSNDLPWEILVVNNGPQNISAGTYGEIYQFPNTDEAPRSIHIQWEGGAAPGTRLHLVFDGEQYYESPGIDVSGLPGEAFCALPPVDRPSGAGSFRLYARDGSITVPRIHLTY